MLKWEDKKRFKVISAREGIDGSIEKTTCQTRFFYAEAYFIFRKIKEEIYTAVINGREPPYIYVSLLAIGKNEENQIELYSYTVKEAENENENHS